MKKIKFSSPSIGALSLTTLFLLMGCGRTLQTGQPVGNTNFIAELNPISKGEQLNPISKGEQLNPGSKGERTLFGLVTLLGSNRYLPSHDIQFYLDGQPIPSDWVELRQTQDNTLAFQVRNIPNAGIHMISARYQGEQLESMIPPETARLDLDLHSSFVVDVVQFANAHNIRRLEQWTPELLSSLMGHEGLKQLLSSFEQTHGQVTPQSLHPWIEEIETQQQVREALKSLTP